MANYGERMDMEFESGMEKMQSCINAAKHEWLKSKPNSQLLIKELRRSYRQLARNIETFKTIMKLNGEL